MKNRILLNNYYLPGELQDHFHQFITYYNHERYHESPDNLTPADVIVVVKKFWIRGKKSS